MDTMDAKGIGFKNGIYLCLFAVEILPIRSVDHILKIVA
jgi:hypothetical protein